MAKTLFDRYFAAVKTQQLAKAALRTAEKNLHDTIAWHIRQEQMYAALNSTPSNTVYIMEGFKPVWEFGYYGNAEYSIAISTQTYSDAETAGVKTNTHVLWKVECDMKAANSFWGKYPDISRHNLEVIEAAQTEVQRCTQRYETTIAAVNSAEQALQGQL